MDISIIIVSYNQTGFLRECIDSIYKQVEELEFEVIVVDNCSSDTGLLKLLKENKSKRDNFDFILNKSNLGFAAANNIGFKASRSRYIVFINRDTVLINNCFKIMVYFLKGDDRAAVCGPRILYPDGGFQVSFYSFPSLAKKFFKVLGFNKLLAKKPFFLKKLSRFNRIMPHYMSLFNANFEDRRGTTEVPWVTGACLMVKNNFFRKAGLFDENYKMYCEDMDFGLRIRENDLKVYFVPEAKIIHHRGWVKRSLRSLNFYFESHRYYYKKNFRGIYKSMLLFLNNFEWTYEKIFFYIRNNLPGR